MVLNPSKAMQRVIQQEAALVHAFSDHVGDRYRLSSMTTAAPLQSCEQETDDYDGVSSFSTGLPVSGPDQLATSAPPDVAESRRVEEKHAKNLLLLLLSLPTTTSRHSTGRATPTPKRSRREGELLRSTRSGCISTGESGASLEGRDCVLTSRTTSTASWTGTARLKVGQVSR